MKTLLGGISNLVHDTIKNSIPGITNISAARRYMVSGIAARIVYDTTYPT